MSPHCILSSRPLLHRHYCQQPCLPVSIQLLFLINTYETVHPVQKTLKHQYPQSNALGSEGVRPPLEGLGRVSKFTLTDLENI